MFCHLKILQRADLYSLTEMLEKLTHTFDKSRKKKKRALFYNPCTEYLSVFQLNCKIHVYEFLH